MSIWPWRNTRSIKSDNVAFSSQFAARGLPSCISSGVAIMASPMSELCTPSGVAMTTWRQQECPFAPAPRQGKHPAASLEASPVAVGSPPASSTPCGLLGVVPGNPWASPVSDRERVGGAVFVPFSRGFVARKLPQTSCRSEASTEMCGAAAGCPRPSPSRTPMSTAIVDIAEAGRAAPLSFSSSAALVPSEATGGADTFNLASCNAPHSTSQKAQRSSCHRLAASPGGSCSHASEGLPPWSQQLGA